MIQDNRAVSTCAALSLYLSMRGWMVLKALEKSKIITFAELPAIPSLNPGEAAPDKPPSELQELLKVWSSSAYTVEICFYKHIREQEEHVNYANQD
ncbi:hypothetical protein AOLI_G00136350 [Acnodon oligacanthus]